LQSPSAQKTNRSTNRFPQEFSGEIVSAKNREGKIDKSPMPDPQECWPEDKPTQAGNGAAPARARVLSAVPPAVVRHGCKPVRPASAWDAFPVRHRETTSQSARGS